MKKRYSLTLYTYDPDMKIWESTVRPGLHAPEVRQTKARGEEIIKELLALYGFMTLPLIRRCLIMKGHGRIDTKKSIVKMQYKGLVKKYTITLKDSDKQDIDIYVLSKEVRAKYKKDGKIMINYRYDMLNIPYLLEHLSLIQWHIACLEKSRIKESAYHWKVSLSDGRIATIPSLTAYKALGVKSFYLCAIPVTKGVHNEELMTFLLNVYLIDEYFKENSGRFKKYVFVLICEDDKQAEDICRYLSTIKETAGLYFLYTSDAATSDPDIDPLSLLYELTVQGGAVERRVISIT